MEGGQKYKLALDSELDIKSSDMLVPVSQPKFQHNRQKYQGHYLPSSVRFEKDGWAAGNDVYQFNITEVFVEAGSFTVSKQNINKNPTYRLLFKDSSKKQVGSVYYNPTNEVISSNVDNVSFPQGVSKSLTGKINGKDFVLATDSVAGTVSLGPGTGSSVVLVSANLKSDYSFEVQLRDSSATINVDFTGMKLPTEYLMNGSYTLGQFSVYSNSVSTWQSAGYSFQVKKSNGNYYLSIYNNNNNQVGSDVLLTVNEGTGLASASFNMTLTFSDVPQVSLQEFFPFFTSINASSLNKTVQSQAASTLEFNQWTYTIEDRENTKQYNSDKLYRNIRSGHGSFDGLYNKQTVEHIIPVWFGISAKPGFDESTEGLSVVSDEGTEVTHWTQNTAGDNRYIHKTATIICKCTSAVKKYSGAVYKPRINVWEGMNDKASEYLTDLIKDITVKVTVRYYIWSDISESDISDWQKVQQTVQHTVTLSTAYSNLTNANVMGMFTVTGEGASDVSVTAVVINGIENTSNSAEYTINLADSPFYNGSDAKVQITTTTAKISSAPSSLKGLISKFANTKAEYRAHDSTTTDGIDYAGVASWGRCCQAKVASNVYIKTDSVLTNAVDASYFGIEKTTISDSTNYVDASSLFKHKIVQAACQDSLTISVYLCSDSVNQIAFYSSTAPGSNDSTIYFMPGHILFGDKKKISDQENSNLQYYTINKSYEATSVDTNYGMQLTINGSPVKTTSNTYFNYITSMYSVVDVSSLLSGNKFTEKSAAEFVSSLSWLVLDWDGYIDISVNDSNDLAYMKEFKQTVRLQQADVNDSSIIKGTLSTDYNLQSSKLSLSGSFNFEDSDGGIWPVTIGPVSTVDDFNADTQKEIHAMSIAMSTVAAYNLSFYLPHVYDSSWTLESLQNNIAYINNGNYRLKIDFDILQVKLQKRTGDSWGTEQECDEDWYDSTRNAVKLVSDYIRSITFVACGVYNKQNVTVNSLTSINMNVTVNGETFDVDIATLINSSQKSLMDFLYTKVNQAELEEVQFAQVESDNELQFLKQQWDTTNETENFWWIDSSHVLALIKSKFVLREKSDELTDWDGDKFEDVSSWDRTSILNSSVLKYFCTSAYAGQYARLVTVANDNGTIQIKIIDPLDDMSVQTFSLTLQKQSLGTALCPDTTKLYTYSDLVLSNMLSQAKWSATCIDAYCIIGLHYDNNFNQWAIVIDLENSKLDRIIQGYGFVGVDGSLTGGEIPAKYFNASKGFTGTVQSLDSLSDKSYNISALSELYAIEDIVVGTDTQQWYISKNIPSVVSHLTYSDGTFIVHELKLNNNYSVDYDSASYASTVFSDYDFKIKPLRDLLPESNSVWTAMLVLWTYPMLYFLDPKISVANYLQQTLGQAAYVHYNSTSIRQQKDLTKETVTNNYSKEESEEAIDRSKEESAIMSDELSFDRQSVKQTQKTSDPYTTVFTMCAAALVSALDWGQEALQVNQFQNQSAIADIGRKYTQNFLQNINSLSIADMGLQSVNPVQTSEVTAIKTLDMFYSTSDQQKIAAGPGYVNHNFVAQCVSQSVTSVQSEYSQQKLLYIISALTMLPIQQLNKGLVSARNVVKAQLAASGGPGWAFVIAGVASGSGMTYTTPSSIGLGVAYAALDIACNITQIGLELLPQMLEALGGNKLNSSIVARQSKHIYDIEGKHKYGSKSECFMWPCFGVESAQSIVDESVEVVIQNKSWLLSIPNKSPRYKLDDSQPSFVTDNPSSSLKEQFSGDVPYYIAMTKGKQSSVTLPEKMAYVLGTESFLPKSDFKNENIGESEPVFPTAPFQDYIIDESWQIGQTASVGMTVWVSCKDTKVIDGELSNCVISEDFCGLAAPYTAIEVKRGIQQQYMRPWAITPQALALNQTGLNCCFEEKAYHAFDGYGYRVVNWCGSAGMNKEHQTWLYSFLVNDRFKRGNKLPQNEYLGNFKSDPVVAITGDLNDKVFTLITQPGEGKGLQAGTVGEDKDVRRYAVPVFSEFVNTLPAAVKTLSAQVLSIIDGITSLTTENRDLQTAYKAPLSVDFTIGKNKYRFTQEYICSLQQERGVTKVQDLVPCLGLEFIGSTPYEAYLYSPATRQYYVFTGGSSLQMVDMIERFRDVVNGRYDFVNQEVLVPCLATFLRLDKRVLDDSDETDNVIVPRLKENRFIGEVWPPLETIFNTRSWFRTLSLPCGVTYQGPNRCIINRFVLQDYMVAQVKNNYGLWKRVPRETYHPFRTYKAQYAEVDTQIGDNVQVKGWTHNPFLLVTAPLGIDEETDNLYEWEITFCWPIEMDKLYAQNNFATVNIQAETMTPGGKVIADRPTHVYLTKELFTTTGNYGYYSFRYQSKCGAGNRERLHIWSDQYVCISSLQVEIKQVTQKRTEQLTQQIDIQRLKEI